MGLARHINRRDANEKEIVKALEAIGATVYRLDKPVDLLVGFRSRTWLLECKTKAGKLTEEQDKFINRWAGQVNVVYTAEQALAIVMEEYVVR